MIVKNKNEKYNNLLKEKHILEYKLDGNINKNIDKIIQEKKKLEIKQDKLKEQIKKL